MHRIVSRCSYTDYVRLVMFSFGFQEALQRGFQVDDEVFFTKSLDYAKSVAIVRFAPDATLCSPRSFGVYARPLILEYTRFITRGSKPKFIAIDERIPMLYLRFLASLLAHHKRDGAARGCLHLQDSPMQQLQASSSAPVY
ncbi:hypothetical protein EDB83DRAFT_1308312 [Lactarius deliciosus]|nr:hypothetical protein EDB83DRAFT_1308312 [Lactarius deliciosus]